MKEEGNIEKTTSYLLVRWLFLRLLGIVYLIAFVSLWVQIKGLIGEDGILPVSSFLKEVYQSLDCECYWYFPTLCWFNSSDCFLNFLCIGGAFLSLLLIINIFPILVLVFLWSFYLSLTTVCRDFLSFQWDILLLETGFIAIFFAPNTILSNLPQEKQPSTLILWLFRWLLFRLMFSSGIVKLISGDETWRILTALNYHYETQPLPNWISWYFYQLPEWFQKTSVVFMFINELFSPFLIFAPKRFRFVGFSLLVIFQILIMITGNYCFFNLLTIALCILMLDDSMLPYTLRKAISQIQSVPLLGNFSWTFPKLIIRIVAVLVLLLSSAQFFSMLGFGREYFFPLLKLYKIVSPFHIVNGYGLFAVMTTSRPEIIIEGSNDNKNWLPYEFKYKPGDLTKSPNFVVPHQPRLDWQMWFAALSSYHQNPWFINFCLRLLQGSKNVLALLAKNPFPDSPPLYIRAVVYNYHFTNIKTRRTEGIWWKRELKGLYCPVLSLNKM